MRNDQTFDFGPAQPPKSGLVSKERGIFLLYQNTSSNFESNEVLLNFFENI